MKLQNQYRINCTNSSHTIVHITATNTNQNQKNDVIHYLFTTIGRPTIVIKRVTEYTNVTINNTAVCQKTGSGFHFNPNDSDISGIVITKVFRYIDSDDTVNLVDSGNIGDDVMKKFQWQVVDVNNDNVNFKATSNNTSGNLYFSVCKHSVKLFHPWNSVNLFHPFQATSFLFQYPLKTSENHRFSDVIRGYRKRQVAWNGLGPILPSYRRYTHAKQINRVVSI